METTKSHSFTVFNALCHAAHSLEARENFGQKKTIKRTFQEIKTYLNMRAITSNVNIKVNSIFFNKGNDCLFVYAIKNGNTLYTIECKRNGLTDFTVVTTDTDERIETSVKKWLTLKLDQSLPVWQAMKIARAAKPNMRRYEKTDPPKKARKTGSQYAFTRIIPGEDTHINLIDNCL